jgi:hypothetical protein
MSTQTWHALVVSHSDGSGVLHVWGPFLAEDDALAVREELRDIGIDGRFDIRPLRGMVPVHLAGGDQ